jgi:hypothetical protein
MPLRLLPAGSRDNLCLTAIQGLVNYKGLPVLNGSLSLHGLPVLSGSLYIHSLPVLNGSLSLHGLPPATKNAVDKTRKVI